MRVKSLWRLPSLFVLISLFSSMCLASGPCNIEILKQVHDKMGSLSPSEVSTFFQTFHKSCAANAEFSEWSNELLFTLLNKQSSVFIETLKKQSDDQIEIIISELESPVNDGINIQEIYSIVKTNKIKSKVQQRIINSLKIAAGKAGITLK